MQGDLVISADFGTSGVKVGVVDGELNIVARVTEPYPLSLAPGGIAEQNPDDWWSGLTRAITDLRKQIPDLRDRASVLVFSAQLCGLICADEKGEALRPCMTWLDKRASPLAQELIGGFPQVHGYQLFKLMRWLRLANGAPAKNGMDAASKILWMQRNAPDVMARTRWLVDAKDWLVHRATGVMTTSPESANLSWMMDSRPGRENWSPQLAAMIGAPLDKLAPIVTADTVVETLTPQAAAELGLNPKTQVLAGTSDVTAAALGSGEVEDGALHISLATSAWIAGFFPDRRLSVPNSYATVTSGLDMRPLLIASQENAGSALDWAAAITGSTQSRVEAFSDLGTALSDDPFFLPWLAGERVPVDNDALRGTFFGLSLHHNAQTVRRAAVEGIALNLKWAMTKVEREKSLLRNGALTLVGGVAASPQVAQMLADALNRDIRVGEARHAGMLGTATLAAATMGWADNPAQAAARLRGHTTAHYTPNPARVEALDTRARHLDKLRRTAVRSYMNSGIQT
ncbi:xylulokinase [Shimia isoporae]|uniref:Xylulokinase n=1 Tax=Shimia isoporae TaxID=647720 RepID=A0A4R1NCY5_9RHOB|nr:FGGY family carbohydrate kinase [Shimia isoporae]TCL01533.1 xylulokinase [Shimia isoporae]